jgi:hypothetical protein
MRIHTLTQNGKTIRLKPDGSGFTVAAGTTAVNGDAVDTLGFESVLLKTAFGAIVSGAVTSVKVQYSDDGSTGWTDIAGTSQTVADTADNTIFITEIHRPVKRYVRVATSRATQNATIDYQEAFLFNPFNAGITQDATVGGVETFVNPVTGTA